MTYMRCTNSDVKGDLLHCTKIAGASLQAIVNPS